MDSIDPAQTTREVEFLSRQMPLPDYRRVLDICCGTGRHANLLAERGYSVFGIDRDASAIRQAQSAAAGESASFQQMKCDELESLERGSFDAAMILWQSFGYGHDEENVSLLRSAHALLRPGGRMVLDIYHREFFERANHLEDRIGERNGIRFIERKSMIGHRLHVEIEYLDGASTSRDQFDWRLYSPGEVDSLATKLGLRMSLCCREFTETSPLSHDVPRVQYVFESE